MKIKQDLDLLPMVLKSKQRSKGKAPIIIRITLNCDSNEVSLSRTVSPENWLVKEKEVSKSEPGFKEINKRLTEALVDLQRIYDQLFLTYDFVTPLMIKRVFKGQEPIEKPTPIPEELIEEFTLTKAFDGYIEEFTKLVASKERSKGTLRQWKSTRKKAIEYLTYKYPKKEIKDITFPEIDGEFAINMYKYFTIHLPKPLSDATAKKHIKKIKQIINIGVTKKIIPTNPIAGFKCGGDTKDIPPLELEEVMRIYNKDFGCDRLNEVRDCFIFQCFSGFAFQDIYGLSPENIIYVGIEKERWLAKHRGKTDGYEIVPILDIVDDLIDRYKSHPKCIVRNALMPVNSNTIYNGYLKEIAVIVGINRKLNTHLARHTFADFMLNHGMSLEEVSRMLGHKVIRTTERYCKVSKGRIKKSFNENVRPELTIQKLKGITTEIIKNKNEPATIPTPFVRYSIPSSTTPCNYNFNYIG
ncbi:site-specific integrase [Edaphocola aurantiacus]|uniref:site-specific integrase n=1 Tax=Edaphocola aurantiacus TaxID=2601682 RepID=UPI001C948EBD|nr:site-specific integrase [Edaphocola aurantiacus]